VDAFTISRKQEGVKMNEKKNPIVKAFAAVIDTITDLLVTVFDGILRGVEHATPSTFSLDATLLPWLLPLPVAFMTSDSMQEYLGWSQNMGLIGGLGLEGLGILVWARLADAVVERKTSHNGQILLGAVALIYETVLVILNVIFALQEGVTFWYATVLFLICLLPMLSAILYGFHKNEVIEKLKREQEENAARAERQRLEELERQERERQERRQDRKEAQELKLKYQAEADGLKIKRREKTSREPFRAGEEH
jgi:hypothetical protein